MVKLTKLPLPRFKPLVCQRQIVNLRVHLYGQLLHRLDYLGVSFLKQADVMSFMCSMDYTFGTYWCGIAAETEILHLLLGMIFAALPYLSHKRVARYRISCSDLGLSLC